MRNNLANANFGLATKGPVSHSTGVVDYIIQHELYRILVI